MKAVLTASAASTQSCLISPGVSANGTMVNAHRDGPNGHLSPYDISLARLAGPPTANLADRPVDQWDAADAAQCLLELDEARAHMTPGEYSESDARLTAFWAQYEERALARYRALHNHTDRGVVQESTNVRTRPLDSHFGSDGNQYNPYAPHTSEEYMLQEIEAGRMEPEMMDTSRHESIPSQSPLSANGPGLPLAHMNADGRASWIAPGSRPRFRRGLISPRVAVSEASWPQHPYNGRAAAEDLDEEETTDVYPTMPPYLGVAGSQASSRSPYGSIPDPVFDEQESPFGVQQPHASSLDPPSLSENFASGVPRQSYPAPTGRERKRLAKPSLVVKLKTESVQKSSQASSSLGRGTSDASSSSESSSARQTTPDSRPFNLRSRGAVGISSTNARSRAGWEPQAVRRLTRRAEAIQSSHRKRRRDAVSPQDVGTEGTTTSTADQPQGKQKHMPAYRISAKMFQLPQVKVDEPVLVGHPKRINVPYCVPKLLCLFLLWRRRVNEHPRKWRR